MPDAIQKLALRRQRAMLDFEDGDLAAAEAALDRIVADLRAAGPPAHYELGRALLDRATVLTFGNRWSEALRDADECERLAQGLSLISSRSLLANVYQQRVKLRSNPRSPLENYKLASQDIARFREMGFENWFVDIAEADLAYQRGDWHSAARLYRAVTPQMESEGWSRGVAATRLRSGRSALESGDLASAGADFDRALDHFEQSGPPDLLAAARIGKARVLAARHQPEAAWTLAESGLGLIESGIRRLQSLFDQQRFMLDKLAQYEHVFEIARAIPGETGVWRAWEVAERAKSAYLCQLVANADVPLFEGVDEALATRLLALESKLDDLEVNRSVWSGTREQLEAQIASLSAERNTVLGAIMRANPRWARMRVPPPLHLRQSLQRLPRGWSALSFFWHGARLHVFAGDAVSASVDWRPDEIAALKESLHKVRTAEAAGLLEMDSVIPRELARRIFPEEIERWLAVQERVLISPHGPLKSAPLHTVRLASGKRLMETAAVQYIPTLALLGLERGEAPHDRVLLLGCERDGFNNPPLEEVPPEIEALQGIWGTRAVHHNLAPDATYGAGLPALSEWRDFRVLHFACHGRFELERPLDARFYLGKQAVRATEIFGVRLNADLACFSACDLGAHGQAQDAFDTAGDEWLGLSLPLFYAGGRTVMVSVGKALSGEAVKVMKVFHAALATGKSPADACQAALRKVEKRPEGFWANWYLAGLPS